LTYDDGIMSLTAEFARSSLCLLGLGLVGCSSSRPYQAGIQSDDPHERILAIREAADSNDTSCVPLLVDRLEDEDEAVRFFAILALEKLTGQRMGYEYGKPLADRIAAVERWRAAVRQSPSPLTLDDRPTESESASGRRSASGS
jgi:hypothetical protein